MRAKGDEASGGDDFAPWASASLLRAAIGIARGHNGAWLRGCVFGGGLVGDEAVVRGCGLGWCSAGSVDSVGGGWQRGWPCSREIGGEGVRPLVVKTAKQQQQQQSSRNF